MSRLPSVSSDKLLKRLLKAGFDCAPENHICFLADEIVQKTDLMEYEKKYEGGEHPAYHPKIMLKILILGIIDGFSPMFFFRMHLLFDPLTSVQ